jgi:hypothetical protein
MIPAHEGGDDRQTGGRRLEQYDRHTLPGGGHHVAVGGLHQLRHVIPDSEKSYTSANAQLSHQSLCLGLK